MEELETVEVRCARCGAKTLHTVLKNVKRHGNETLEKEDVDYDYQIVECNGCKKLAFVANIIRYVAYRFPDVNDEFGLEVTENIDIAPRKTINIYPPRPKSRGQFEHLDFLPHKIKKIYFETFQAFAADLFALSAIGLRAIVELTCKHKGIKKGKLEVKIDKLFELGLITVSQADSLHEIRNLGNGSAHDGSFNNENIINTGFNTVEHLLREIFYLPESQKNVNINHQWVENDEDLPF